MRSQALRGHPQAEALHCFASLLANGSRCAAAFIILTLIASCGTLLANPTFEVSTFNTGTDGWEPNSPWITSTAMPIAPDDPYLLLDVGASAGNRGSKLITFNPTEAWTGDYLGANVTGVSLDVANWSESDTVFLRVVVGNRANPQQSGGTWWISNTATTLLPGQDWTQVELSLLEEDLVRVGNLEGDIGTDSYAATFSDVQNIRILSAVIPIGATGDEFVGPVGMDNIGLIPEPSTYLLIGLGLLAIGITKYKRCAIRNS